MNIWRRVGISLILITVVLALVLWNRLLPFPFLLLTALYVAAFYFATVKKVGYRWSPVLIAVVAIPTGSFIFTSHNSLAFWLSNALSIVGAAAVSLAIFQYETPHESASV